MDGSDSATSTIVTDMSDFKYMSDVVPSMSRVAYIESLNSQERPTETLGVR